MGLFDFFKRKTRGILTEARPAEGVAPAPEPEVRQRLLAVGGRGIETAEEDGDVVVAWSAKIAGAGDGGAEYQYLYRAIRVSLDPEKQEASGICLKTTTEAELDVVSGGLKAAKEWERGQHIGLETVRVLAWLGPHATSGGAGEEGFRFDWKDLRTPVIEAVTGAGWTYKPKQT